MNPQMQFCPNVRCHASGQRGSGNIVVHCQQQQRYKCKCCGTTFSETHGTSLYRVKKTSEQFVLVVTLLNHGCPVQAIVAAFGLDERTVRSWLHKAGGITHGQSSCDKTFVITYTNKLPKGPFMSRAPLSAATDWMVRCSSNVLRAILR